MINGTLRLLAHIIWQPSHSKTVNFVVDEVFNLFFRSNWLMAFQYQRIILEASSCQIASQPKVVFTCRITYPTAQQPGDIDGWLSGRI